MAFRSLSVLCFLASSVKYTKAQDATIPPTCTIGFGGDSIARVCNCDGSDTPYPLLADPSSPGACAYTTLPAPPASDPAPPAGDPGVFTAQMTTITNADGSSFTGLLEPITDATGGVSTMTVTINAVAGGGPDPTTAVPSSTDTSIPAFITAVVSGVTHTFSQSIFPDLATITAPITVTTQLPEVDSTGSTTTTLVPIIIGPGGIGFVGPVPLPPDFPVFPDPKGPPAPPPPPQTNPPPPQTNPPPPTTGPPDTPTTTENPDSCSTQEVPQCVASCVDDGTSTSCTTTTCSTATGCTVTGFTTSVTTTTSEAPLPTVDNDIETSRPADDPAVDVIVQVFLTSIYSDFGINDITQPPPPAPPASSTVESPSTTEVTPPAAATCALSSDCDPSKCPGGSPICNPIDNTCICGSSSLNLGPIGPPPTAVTPPPPSETCVDQSQALGVVVCAGFPCSGGQRGACVGGLCTCKSKRDLVGSTLEKVYLPSSRV